VKNPQKVKLFFYRFSTGFAAEAYLIGDYTLFLPQK
jgi:hypothetical protein